MNQLAPLQPPFSNPPGSGPYDNAVFHPNSSPQLQGNYYHPPQSQQQQQQPAHQAFSPAQPQYSSLHGVRSSTPRSGILHDGRPQHYASQPYGAYDQRMPQQQQQQQQHSLGHSVSPPAQQQQQLPQYSHRASPPNAAAPQTHYPTPPTKFPMAAPPLPNTPTANPPTTTTPTASATSPPKTPLSPASKEQHLLDQSRIALLLDLNAALLAEVSRLQSIGQGGALHPTQAEAARARGQPDKLASDDYIHIMRRLQANLQYMMHKQQPASGAGKEVRGPAVMTPPPQMVAELGPMYERLREMYPGWEGVEARATPGRSTSGGQMGGANGGQ